MLTDVLRERLRSLTVLTDIPDWDVEYVTVDDGVPCTQLGSGTSRIVFEIPGVADLVLKVSVTSDPFGYSQSYMSQCAREWALWDLYISRRAERYQKLFAATSALVVGASWVATVQRRVNDGGLGCRELAKELKQSRDLFCEFRDHSPWVGDLHGGQWTYSAPDHEFVCVDYACTLDNRLPKHVKRALERTTRVGREKVRMGEKPLVIGGVDELNKL